MADSLHLVVSMGVYNPRQLTYLDNVRLGQALLTFHSIARTTPDCIVHFIYTGVGNDYLSIASRTLGMTGSAAFDPIFLSSDKIREMLQNTKMNPIGTHSMVRLVLPEILPDAKDCIWVDCDVVVFDDLNKMAAESRGALKGNGLMFAGSEETQSDGHGWSCVNAGVLFMDLERMRRPGMKERIISMCDRVTDESGSGLTLHMIDQDVVNALGVAHIDRKWNITLHGYNAWDKLPDDKGCLHFTGEKKYAWSPYSETPNYAFLKDYSAELLKKVPEIPEKWIAVGSTSLAGERGVPHRVGASVTLVNEPQPVMRDCAVEAVDVAYGVSGDEYLAKALPVSLYSVAEHSSVPVRFHVVYMPGTVSDQSIQLVNGFVGNLSYDHACSMEMTPLRPDLVEAIRNGGGGHKDSYWRDHLVTCFLHDIPDIDICVKLDADVLLADDIAKLVKYCVDRGLGETKHLFGCRSPWRNTFCAEYNLGVAPESFRMFRESGFDEYVRTQLVYGRRVISDDLQSMLVRAGILKCGSYPAQWNMVGRVRQDVSRKDVVNYQRYDVFYGKKYRIDGYEPVLCQQDYRRSTKGYHFSVEKPWRVTGGKSLDPDYGLWVKYANSAGVYMPEVVS